MLLLAATLRWVEPGLVELKYDEAHVTALALQVTGGDFWPVLSGGTSWGIQRPALDVYLLAAALALGGRHVEAAVWGVGALGLLAVALTYALGRRIGGARVGLLAALFMAANPWLVFYDRKLWAHIQVVFSVVLLRLAWELVVRRRGWAAFWFPVIVALQGLTHILAVAQALSWLGGFASAPRRWLRWQTLGGLAVGVVLVAPYLVALARGYLTSGLTPGQAATGVATQVGSWASVTPVAAWRQAASLFAGVGLTGLVGLPASQSVWWQAANALVVPVLLVMGLGLVRILVHAAGGATADENVTQNEKPSSWIRGFSRFLASRVRPAKASNPAPHQDVFRIASQGDSPREVRAARLLLAWTIGPLLALGVGLVPVYLQYWTILLPLPALYFAFGLDGLAGRGQQSRANWQFALRSAGGALAGVFTAALVVVWIGSHVALLSAVDAGAGGAAFGVSLKRWQVTLAEARSWAARLGTQEIRVAVDGVDPGYDGEPAAVALLVGNPPWARFVAPASPPALLLSYDRPSLYLLTIQSPETEQAHDRLGERVWEGELAAGHAPARLYRLPHAQAADLGIQRLDPPPAFDAGLALLGYRFPDAARAEKPFQVTLVWRVLDPPPAVRTSDMTAFNHVLAAGDERVGQVDGLALLSRDWWPGDVLVQSYLLTLPAGTYRWRVGLYSRTEGGRAQLADGGGDFVDLGPLVVR